MSGLIMDNICKKYKSAETSKMADFLVKFPTIVWSVHKTVI